MGSSVVVGVFVIMLATAMMSQLPSTSHCLMNKSISSTASSNWCINGSTHQYCQQLIIPQDEEEGVDDLDLEPMNMIMKHMPVDDSHHETSHRMLSNFYNNPGFTGNSGGKNPAVTCDRNRYPKCNAALRINQHALQCRDVYHRAC